MSEGNINNITILYWTNGRGAATAFMHVVGVYTSPEKIERAKLLYTLAMTRGGVEMCDSDFSMDNVTIDNLYWA